MTARLALMVGRAKTEKMALPTLLLAWVNLRLSVELAARIHHARQSMAGKVEIPIILGREKVARPPMVSPPAAQMVETEARLIRVGVKMEITPPLRRMRAIMDLLASAAVNLQIIYGNPWVKVSRARAGNMVMAGEVVVEQSPMLIHLPQHRQELVVGQAVVLANPGLVANPVGVRLVCFW